MRTIDVFDLDRIDLGAEERAAYQRGDMLLAAALGALIDGQESAEEAQRAADAQVDEAERLADAKDDDLRELQDKVRAGLEDLVNLLVPVPGKRLSRNTLVDRIAVLTRELGL